MHIVHVQRQCLRYAQPRTIQQLRQRKVAHKLFAGIAPVTGRLCRGLPFLIQHGKGLIHIQRLGMARFGFGVAHPVRGNGLNHLASGEIAKKTPQG